MILKFANLKTHGILTLGKTIPTRRLICSNAPKDKNDL